jgi:hypothetical protein
VLIFKYIFRGDVFAAFAACSSAQAKREREKVQRFKALHAGNHSEALFFSRVQKCEAGRIKDVGA